MYCDGFVDCPHGEDEFGCLSPCPNIHSSFAKFSSNNVQRQHKGNNCSEIFHFRCNKEHLILDMHRCDFVKDCESGEDENRNVDILAWKISFNVKVVSVYH